MYKVKVISLKRREDRRIKMLHNFQHIPFEFVDGLDGRNYQLTDEDIEFIKYNEYERFGIHIPSLVCANYTHLNLIDECANQPEDESYPYFIFEDDVELVKPLDWTFEEIAERNDLDVFWLIPNEPSILAYVVWPSGAKILIDHINEVKLNRGLDWQFHNIKGSGKLREDQLSSSYFTQQPGVDSDITIVENYDISSNK
tara:strand:+ start:1227 stop:1823 length:597 start_codon:yes stop_codon:yes gene_type:complete